MGAPGPRVNHGFVTTNVAFYDIAPRDVALKGEVGAGNAGYLWYIFGGGFILFIMGIFADWSLNDAD